MNLRDTLTDDDVDTEVQSLGITVPRWIDADITTGTVESILYGGCDSGAYMLAVTYHTAERTMSEHGDAEDGVLEYIEGEGFNLPTWDGDGSWSLLACSCVSLAVELWCSAVEQDILDALDVDDDS